MDRIVDLRRIFDSVAEIWILIDPEGKVLLASKHLEKYRHVIRPPVRVGSSLFESIPDSWLQLAKNIRETLMESPVPYTLETSYTLPGGKMTHFEIKCTAVRDDHAVVAQIFIEARDVTPQKIFENKITIVAREYQSVIEHANAVIIGTDARGYITEWNETTRQVTGYSKNEAYLQRFSDFLLPQSQEQYADAIKRVLGGDVIANHEMILGAADGRALTLLINATPRSSTGGDVVGILLIGQDITELSAYRKSLEDRVRERTEALNAALDNERKLVEVKDRFVSMASHEFRSPISYINRNIGAIKDNIEKLTAVEIRDRLAKIQSQADHLSSLLEDVLTMGKTGASNTRITANLKTVEMGEFFTRIIDEVQSNTNQTHQIELDFPFSALLIQSDENLLRNIFVNLLSNAIKFSPGKDRVYVSVDSREQQVVFRVKDEGLGIDENDLSKIFEPFHRGQNVEMIKGTGLGLPIVKRAVETLGGTVKVESQAGAGTVVQVTLNL